MPLTVRCEKCSKRLQAPDAAAGKRVKCPGCGAAISIPAAVAAAAATPAARAPKTQADDLFSELEADGLFSGGPLGNLDKLSQAAEASLPSPPRGSNAGFDPLGPTPVSSKKRLSPAIIIGASAGAGTLLLLVVVLVVILGSGSDPDTSTTENTPAVALADSATPAPAAVKQAASLEPADLADFDLAELAPLPGASPAPAANAAPQPANVNAAAPPPVAESAPVALAVASQPGPPANSAPVATVIPAPVASPVAVNLLTAVAPAAAPVNTFENKELRQAQFKSLRDRYQKLLVGDPEALVQQVRWVPAAKRPSIGVRWGVSMVIPRPSKGKNSRPQAPKVAANEEEISAATGTAGKALLAGINQRIGNGDFGDDSMLYGVGQAGHIDVLPGDERGEILAAARERNVDFVIMLKFEYQLVAQHFSKGKKKGPPHHHQQHFPQGGGGGGLPVIVMPPHVPPVLVATLSARIMDVSTAASGWTSDTLSGKARKDAEQDAQEWAKDVLEHLDQYKLQPVPAMEAEEVKKRVTELQKKKLVNPLPALLEVRYYQLKYLISKDRASEFFTEALGDDGSLLASDDAGERQQALAKVGRP